MAILISLTVLKQKWKKCLKRTTVSIYLNTQTTFRRIQLYTKKETLSIKCEVKETMFPNISPEEAPPLWDGGSFFEISIDRTVKASWKNSLLFKTELKICQRKRANRRARLLKIDLNHLWSYSLSYYMKKKFLWKKIKTLNKILKS